MKHKKRGRPTIQNPKNHQYTLHLNDSELSTLVYLSEKTGNSKGEILRKGLDLLMIKMLDEEEYEHI